jgi:hypothetical protein
VLVVVLVLEGMRAWTETAAVARRKKRLPSQDEAMMMMRLFWGKGEYGGQQTERKRMLWIRQSREQVVAMELLQWCGVSIVTRAGYEGQPPSLIRLRLGFFF